MQNIEERILMSETVTEKTYTCLVSGDSISKGVVYDEGKGRYTVLDTNYVALVQKKIKGVVRNVSRFGNTLTRGMGRLGSDIAKNRPDIVLIEYGGNDCDFDWNEVAANPEIAHEPKTGLLQFEKTLTETITSLKEEAIVPVLMTLPPLDPDRYLEWVSKHDALAEGNILKWLGSVVKIYWWQERYSSSIVTVAEKTDTRWIDIRGAFLRYPDFSKLICRDGIHPNREGHILIASTIVDYISANFASLLADGGVPVLA
jgi:lysophospholipase L1-like esterase